MLCSQAKPSQANPTNPASFASFASFLRNKNRFDYILLALLPKTLWLGLGYECLLLEIRPIVLSLSLLFLQPTNQTIAVGLAYVQFFFTADSTSFLQEKKGVVLRFCVAERAAYVSLLFFISSNHR